MATFEYEIVKNVGVLSSRGAWNLELNFIKWGSGSPSFDLRKWDANHTRMSKGCTLNRAELIALRDLLNTIELE